jgi:hypothetical protein
VYRDGVTYPQPQTAPGGAPGYPPGPPLPYGYHPAPPDRLSRFFTRASRYTPAWLGPVAVAGTCAAASAYVLLWANPGSIGADAVPTCLVKLTTGYDCPGCGGTRAMWFLLHGDLGAAAQHHLLFVFAVPFLVYAYVAWAAGVLFKRRLPQFAVSVRGVVVGLILLTAFTVLRNLPFEPFSLFYV